MYLKKMPCKSPISRNTSAPISEYHLMWVPWVIWFKQEKRKAIFQTATIMTSSEIKWSVFELLMKFKYGNDNKMMGRMSRLCFSLMGFFTSYKKFK